MSKMKERMMAQMSGLIKGISRRDFLKFVLAGGACMLVNPLKLFAQDENEYPDSWIDQSCWSQSDFVDFGGGPWKMFFKEDEGIAVKVMNKKFYDYVADKIHFTVYRTYLLTIAIRSLKDYVKLDAYRDFSLSDAKHNKTIDWIVDGSCRAYAKPLYEKFNNLELSPNPGDGKPSDIITVGTGPYRRGPRHHDEEDGMEEDVKRTLTFIVAQTTLQGPKVAEFTPFLDETISLNYGQSSFVVDNLDRYGKWYKHMYIIETDP